MRDRFELPAGSAAFVFGSAKDSECPADLDLLIAYDPLKCSPKLAPSEHRSFCHELQVMMGLPVDITLLTHDEARSSDFIADVGAIPLQAWMTQQVLSHGTRGFPSG